jgi:large subunit ribosomal protein L28
MARKCQLSGISRQCGNRVSHAKNRTKHVFKANIQRKKFFHPESGQYVTLKVSTRMMRTIDKIGLDSALKDNGLTIADVM